MTDYLKNGIAKGIGSGKVCGFCDKTVLRGSPCVTVKARVNAVVTVITVKDEAHPDCARRVARLLLAAADECDNRGAQ